MHRTSALLLSALLALVAIPQATSAADPFEINVIIPLTGGAAFLGKSEQVSLGIAEELINKDGGIRGRPVHFAIQDDQTTPQLAVQLLNGLLAKNVPIVMGSTLTAICGAMAPLVRNGPVLWCFSNAYHPADDGWIFVSGVSTNDITGRSTRFARERGWRRIALLATTDASGADAEHTIDLALALPENAGQAIVAREHFNPADISVAAQASRIKAADAQVVYGLTSGTAFGTILHGLSDAGVEAPVITLSSNETYAQMKLYASFLPKELFFATVPTTSPEVLPNGPTKRAIATFANAFSAKGVEPDTGSNQAWDAAFIVAGAFKRLGTTATPAQLRTYLDTLRGFVGSNGPYDFRAFPKHGLGPEWTIVQRWDPVKQTFVAASKPGGSPL